MWPRCVLRCLFKANSVLALIQPNTLTHTLYILARTISARKYATRIAPSAGFHRESERQSERASEQARRKAFEVRLEISRQAKHERDAAHHTEVESATATATATATVAVTAAKQKYPLLLCPL